MCFVKHARTALFNKYTIKNNHILYSLLPDFRVYKCSGLIMALRTEGARNLLCYSHEIIKWLHRTNKCRSPSTAGKSSVHRKWTGINSVRTSVSLFSVWNLIWWCEILHQSSTWLRGRKWITRSPHSWLDIRLYHEGERKSLFKIT